MRQLVVPVCLCLAALPWSLGPNPKVPLADFSAPSPVNGDLSATADEQESTRDKDMPQESPQGLPQESSEESPEFSLFSAERGAINPDDLTELLPPPLPPVQKPVVDRSRAEICDTLTQAAQSNDVPVPFFIRLLFQESGFKPGVVSPAGAQGIAQFMPETAAEMGVDNPFDPLPAIRASARLLRGLVQQFGNLGLAAAAYNAGPKRIQDWLAKKGKLPQETQGYVRSITGRAAERWTAAQAGSPAVKIPRRAPCQDAAGLLAWNGPERIPMPPTRTRSVNTTIAAHPHVKVKVATGTAVAKPAKPVKPAVAAKAPAPTTVILAAQKQKHHALQLSQR